MPMHLGFGFFWAWGCGDLRFQISDSQPRI
jgi:hypothetical protein